MATVRVVSSGTGRLDAWIDFQHDGSWADAGDQIFTSTMVTQGSQTLSFQVPPNAVVTDLTFSRFRLSSHGHLSYTGLAADGEVEGYGVRIVAARRAGNDNSHPPAALAASRPAAVGGHAPGPLTPDAPGGRAPAAWSDPAAFRWLFGGAELVGAEGPDRHGTAARRAGASAGAGRPRTSTASSPSPPGRRTER
jgi:hypothetical protein